MIRTDLHCPDCGALMRYRAHGRYGPFYACPTFPKCRGAHGAHPDGRPLGTPATAAVRAARIHAHEFFDRLWKNGNSHQRGSRRRRAYAKLRQHLGMTREQCHIGSFDETLCARVVDFARACLEEREHRKAHTGGLS